MYGRKGVNAYFSTYCHIRLCTVILLFGQESYVYPGLGGLGLGPFLSRGRGEGPKGSSVGY